MNDEEMNKAYAEAAAMEPSTYDCVYAALSNADESGIQDIAEIITGAIEKAHGAIRDRDGEAEAINTIRAVINILSEIYEYDDQNPVANGWVGSDGRP